MKRIPERRKKPAVTIEHINPLKSTTLRTLTYSSNGEICSSDKNLNNTLNLNGSETGLVECRYQALITLQKEIEKKFPNRTVPKNYFEELLYHFLEESENKPPYIGIIIAWLQKKSGINA